MRRAHVLGLLGIALLVLVGVLLVSWATREPSRIGGTDPQRSSASGADGPTALEERSRRTAGLAASPDGSRASAAVTPPPSDPRGAALFACEGRADFLFVGRCRQRCQLESRGRPEAERVACVQRCGTQPERAAFVKGCVAKAGFP